MSYDTLLSVKRKDSTMTKGCSQRHLHTLFFSLFFLSSPVFALQYHWQGPYVGAYLGEELGYNHVSTDVGSVTDTSYFSTSSDINAVDHAGSSSSYPFSPMIGIQAGHDWVWKNMIYGVAFDYGALHLSSSETSSRTYSSTTDQFTITTAMNTNWLFTLRGRLGYEILLNHPSLLYVTGGMAMTQLNVKNNFSDTSSLSAAGGDYSTENKIGWTAGVGIELAAFTHTTLDFEYLFVHVPSVKTESTISNSAAGFGVPAESQTSPFTTTGHFHANLLKIALNYRFDE